MAEMGQFKMAEDTVATGRSKGVGLCEGDAVAISAAGLAVSRLSAESARKDVDWSRDQVAN
jgi:hypothetical protein